MAKVKHGRSGVWEIVVKSVVRVASLAFVLMLSGGVASAQTAKPAAAPAKAAAPQARPAAASSQPISRGVFLSNMDADFRKMDADKNGTVTRAEVEGFERAVSVLKAQARNRQMFARLDADHNGQISQAEFARLVLPQPVDASPTLARMDLNRDQSISLVEYRTATLANFDRMDADKDGIVTPAEMKAGGVGR